MIFEERKITLKNGIEAVFKTPELDDAEKMLDYIIKACGETEFLLRYPEEWQKNAESIENERNWINNLRSSKNTLSIACYINGDPIGHCELGFMSGMKTSHRANVAIAIHKAYWELGIGSYMFEEMIKYAKSREIMIMELDFIEGNDRALRLYEKFGFKIVAEKPNMFCLHDGSMKKEYYMQKHL